MKIFATQKNNMVFIITPINQIIPIQEAKITPQKYDITIAVIEVKQN